MKSLTPIVVWIPMLDADELPLADKASARFGDLDVSQFWDGAKKLGNEVGHSVGADGWTAWDVYLVYAPGAEWTAAGLPAPAAALAQAGGVVVGTPGTLPPAGDQSRVPRRMRGHADAVGEQPDLESLLSRVAEGFAKRYAATP